MIKIIFVDKYSEAYTDLVDIFPYAETKKVAPEIKENFFKSYSELKYSLVQYSKRLDNLLKEGSPGFNHYLPEIQQIDTIQREYFLEVYDMELSYNFKSFIIFSKAVMDRLIPFFDYKFGTNLKKFSNSGEKLLNYLKINYKGSNRNDFIDLLERNKDEWLDDLIELRDEIVHFSSLEEYVSFHCVLKGDSGKSINSINDLRRPTIKIDRKEILAVDFLQFNFNHIKTFTKDFVALCYS